MTMGSAFRVGGIEPRSDPAWAIATADARRAYWQAVVGFVVAAKDRELAAGLDRFGAAMVPIAASTRAQGRHRSYTRMGSRSAPPLDPAYSASRTRSLFTGRAAPDHAEFFWRTDGVTGLPWGRVLSWHRKGSARLPVRDVIGLAPQSLAKVKAEADLWWADHKRGIVRRAEPVAPIEVAKIAATGRTDFGNFTFGAGSRERARAALDAGLATGFRQLPPRPQAAARDRAPDRPFREDAKTPGPAAMRPIPGPARPKADASATARAARAKAEAEARAKAREIQATIDPTIPEHVDHIRDVAEWQDRKIDELAAEVGLAVAEYRARLRATLKKAVDFAEIYVRVDSTNLPLILGSGRFKTQFETNTSGGDLSPQGRESIEAKLMGIPRATPDRDRPIYGYLSAPDFIATNTAREAGLESYGDVAIKLKPGVRKRASLTVGDSLVGQQTMYASPLDDPSERSIPIGGAAFRTISEGFIAAKSPDDALAQLQIKHDYIEAHYQGGVTADDIEEIGFPSEPTAAIRALLASQDIRWRNTERGARGHE